MNPSIRAGELDQILTFRSKTIAYDARHQPIETWADSFTIYGGVITEGGREFYAAQKKNAETSAVMKVRYRPTINERMRVKWGHREFEILPPINDVSGKHVVMMISAKEVV